MSIRNGRSYEAYINSSAWESRRGAYFASHSKACSACGGKEKIHLHHKTYERMGEELDEDLAPLCEFCHSTLHRWHNEVGGSLLLISEKFIEHFRNARKAPAPQPTSDFVPKHLRGAERDSAGRLISTSDWRTECRDLRTDRSSSS